MRYEDKAMLYDLIDQLKAYAPEIAGQLWDLINDEFEVIS